MEFRVLGPLEVVDGDAKLPLGGPRQRLVLASLLVEANRVVPTDRLIDRMWGEEPPEAARSALFAYISRLKKIFGSRIQARPPGYILLATVDEIDALRFSALAEAARSTDDAVSRVKGFAEALALWRGEPLSDLAGYEALRPAITRLEEQHLAALEDHADALIEADQLRQVVPLLEGLVAEHPLRERLWASLMLALYRSGRQGDALAAFHRARSILLEELGIDPSVELRQLHQQILDQDAALDRLADRGTPQLRHGLAPSDGADAVGSIRRRAHSISGPAFLALLFLVAGALLTGMAAWALLKPHGLPAGNWTIALDMPLSRTDDAALGQLIRNAVELAIDDVNAKGGIGGSTLSVSVFDDMATPERAMANARTVVADPSALALIGPWSSADTFGVLPITNEAGLLECSPSATHPGLTKPRYGALDLRPAGPAAQNFVRLPPSDDIQSIALAAFAYHDLNARSVLVIDDAQAGGREIAGAFESAYGKLGGNVIRRTLNPGSAPATVLDALTSTDPPEVVFVAAQADVAAAVRIAMADGGWLSIPLLSWDALLYYSGVFFQSADAGPYVAKTGAYLADGTYAAHASVPDLKFSFADAYRARFQLDPDEYSGAGYACVEIIAAALREIAPGGPAAADLRPLVRSYVADPSHRYATVVGDVSFDANGDALQQFVTFYRFDASAADGAGDWIVFKKQDFGPAP